MARTEHGGGEDSGSDVSSGSGGGTPVDFGGGPGQVSFDADRINAGAARLDATGDRVQQFANGNVEFASYAPLQHGEGDESWAQFSPKYFERSQAWLDLLNGLALAQRGLVETVRHYCGFGVATEEANSQRANFMQRDEAAPVGQEGYRQEPPMAASHASAQLGPGEVWRSQVREREELAPMEPASFTPMGKPIGLLPVDSAAAPDASAQLGPGEVWRSQVHEREEFAPMEPASFTPVQPARSWERSVASAESAEASHASAQLGPGEVWRSQVHEREELAPMEPASFTPVQPARSWEQSVVPAESAWAPHESAPLEPGQEMWTGVRLRGENLEDVVEASRNPERPT